MPDADPAAIRGDLTENVDAAQALTENVDAAQALTEIVGAAHTLTEPDVVGGYAVDWTGRWRGAPLAVVRPADTGQVAAVVTACAAAGVPVVPQGGNTGLVGGAVPVDGSVPLSLRRLDSRGPVDAATRTAAFGAGVPLAEAQRHVAADGWEIGVDLAARDTATIGGLVATNAGGERVIRHGLTRGQVAGIEAVLADGSVVRRMTGLLKDNVGYDLGQLLIGSEGTLGVVTAVRLRVVPAAARRAVALVGCGSVAGAVDVLAGLRPRLDAGPGELVAAEMFVDDGLALVREHTGLGAPLPDPHPAYLLVETTGGPDDALPEALAEALEATEGVRDAVVADEPARRAALWEYRERHTEAVAADGTRRGAPPVKLDVSLPPASLGPVVDDVRGVLSSAYPDAVLYLWGHLAEGNLHLNVLGVDPADERAATDLVLRTVAAAGGSIGAEHGIGRAKVPWVGLSRSPAELAAMRAVKSALDPARLLNPGVLFD
jgi:FAD/FMN-containing dehydrogenase